MNTIKILIIFLTFSLSSYSQQLSLTDAITEALENNYNIKISNARQEIANINNSWGAAGRYPYVNLSAISSNAIDNNTDEDFSLNQLTGEAAVNWTLFDGFAVQINKQRFEELEQQSKQNTAILVESTIQSVVLAYYNTLLQKEKLTVFNEIMSLSEDRYKQTKVRKELGSAVTYDLLQAENAYLSDRSNYLLQEVNYKNALRDLMFIMADKSDVTYELTGKFEAIPKNYNITDLQSQLMDNNKTLQNQYINQHLLENAVASAQSSFYPTLNFRSGVSHRSTKRDFENRGIVEQDATNIYGNFTLTFNLFSGGSKRRALQIAKIKEEIGVVEIEQIKQDLSYRLRNMFELYLVRKELLDLANKNLNAAKLNLSISKDKFESGVINSFNYRDIQNLYLNASQQKLEAIYNFIDTHTALLRMVGGIVQEYE